MTYDYVQAIPTTRPPLYIACVAAVAVAFMVFQVPLVHATDIEPPSVPSNLQVPEGHKAFLEGHAIGTQNYMCLPEGTSTSITWMPIGPQATLFNDHDEQIITHFLSPNPDENGSLALLGSTHVIPAPSGPCRRPPPTTPRLSSRVQFPGSGSWSLALNPAPRVVTG